MDLVLSETKLDAFGRNMDDEELIALCAKLPGSSISSLFLSRNCFSLMGISALAKALPASKVTVLCVSYNVRVGDAGLIALASVLPHTKLTDLYLRGIGAGDEGMLALIHAIRMNPNASLRRVYVSNNAKISAKLLLELEAALSEIKHCALPAPGLVASPQICV